mmetsp:Transcript_2316/g.6143  ORF Transcript_2316/g.6143 Transcript_2316/m.6143 type:complete len:961 (-) Transcript_2316:115-2997(-)
MADIEKGLDDEKPAQAVTLDEFVPTNVEKGLTAAEVEASREKWGTNEIPVSETPLYVIFLRQFVGFLPFLIELAAIVALAVQDWVDFAIIACILLVNAVLGFREEYHAKKALDEVSNSIDSEIAVRRDGETTAMSVSKLVPGDIILLVGGTIVPADTKWLKGDIMQIDTAAMTGEPIPRKYPSADHGDVLMSGTTCVAGECYGQVLRTGQNTEIGQAQADILKDKSVRVVSVFQKKIMLVIQILVSACLCVVIAVLLVQGLVYDGFKTDARQTISDALAIMIASIPVALPLVLQVNLALGASFMAKEHHAIVTSIPALQDIASMSMLCSDKTGTLTTANMSIILEQVYTAEGFEKDDVILYAYLCSNADKKDDPIDKAIITAFKASSASSREEEFRQTQIIGFNPTVKRVVAFVESMVEADNGKIYTIAKGLPAKILDTEAGSRDDHELQWKVDVFKNKKLMAEISGKDENLSKSGYKTIGIAICEGDARELENPVWKFVGLLPMLDPPRADTKATIDSLHYANISVKMITGDHVNVGKETARLIGLGTDIRTGEEVRNAPSEIKKQMIWEADGFAAVLPSDKREVVLILRNEFGLVTGMTGDGVNDAPALSAAQVGIAVEGATDAAKNAADLILTQSGLSPIYGAVLESRRIFARIKSYVVYRVAASIVMVLTLSIIIFAKGCSVDSLLVIILALLNDLSMIPVAYDNAKATTRPQLPNAMHLVLQSLFYGVMLTGGGLIFIFLLDHFEAPSNQPISLTACDDPTKGFVWFHLVMVTEIAIFSVRAPTMFYADLPSLMLFASVFITCVIGAIIAIFANDLSAANMGIIVAFNIGLFILTDVLKIWFRNMIGDKPGDIIESDDLIELGPQGEVEKYAAKQVRYSVHRDSVQRPEDMRHSVEVVHRGHGFTGALRGFFSELRPNNITSGYIHKRRNTYVSHGAPTGSSHGSFGGSIEYVVG